MGVEIAGGDESGYARHLLEVGEGKVPVVHTLRQHKIRLKDKFWIPFRRHWTAHRLRIPRLGTQLHKS